MQSNLRNEKSRAKQAEIEKRINLSELKNCDNNTRNWQAVIYLKFDLMIFDSSFFITLPFNVRFLSA